MFLTEETELVGPRYIEFDLFTLVGDQNDIYCHIGQSILCCKCVEAKLLGFVFCLKVPYDHLLDQNFRCL